MTDSERDAPTWEEKDARYFMEKLTGATVTQADFNGHPPGMPDWKVEYRDGALGWIEVIRATEQDSEHLLIRLAKDGEWDHAPGNWSWSIVVDDARQLSLLRPISQAALRLIEAQGDVNFQSTDWFLTSTDNAIEKFRSNPPRQITVRPDARHDDGYSYINWAAYPGPSTIETSGEHVSDLLDLEIATPNLQRHIAKLERQAGDERHLYIRAEQSDLGNSLWMAGVFDREMVPTRTPTVPATISHLWLVDLFSLRFFIWERTTGWHYIDSHEEKEVVLPGLVPLDLPHAATR
ncbi:MAG TPA: hypothetical protein VGM94_11955 [Galbitalea sp.]|jgi:hypothetical protein